MIHPAPPHEGAVPPSPPPSTGIPVVRPWGESSPNLAPEPTPSRRRSPVLLAIVAVVVLLTAAGAVTGYLLTRPGEPRMAVGDCVSRDELPVEYACADDLAVYRVHAREPMQHPFALSCMKFEKATRAVADPSPTDGETVLCLEPTEKNATDAGGLRPGDCIDVRKSGGEIERSTCGFTGGPHVVIATELHVKVPVTDRACESHPETREAYAQSSLGGRAVVICTKPAEDSDSMAGAFVGECASNVSMKTIACAHRSATHRVLSVRTQYTEPADPKCEEVTNANAASVSVNDNTDLRVVVCLGPIDQNHLGYARPGDCVTGYAGTAGLPRLVSCDDSSADGRVTSVYDEANIGCSAGEARMSREAGVSHGSTICLVAT
ncbi:hypothetical protein [Nocardia coubleae]|uniref:Uncharacterized protein n=1 Tax=Nocardia coubleae TaxID=356147 RepID=A0A846W723_9NOCA|nr:hypothetical protein [Nocardia coubleae]NKX88633.1 hypothetical protein [Nocardia coubleae]